MKEEEEEDFIEKPDPHFVWARYLFYDHDDARWKMEKRINKAAYDAQGNLLLEQE